MKSAVITPCGHFFHASCLKKWLYVQETCPLCHSQLKSQSPPVSTSASSAPDAPPANQNVPEPKQKESQGESATEEVTWAKKTSLHFETKSSLESSTEPEPDGQLSEKLREESEECDPSLDKENYESQAENLVGEQVALSSSSVPLSF